MDLLNLPEVPTAEDLNSAELSAYPADERHIYYALLRIYSPVRNIAVSEDTPEGPDFEVIKAAGRLAVIKVLGQLDFKWHRRQFRREKIEDIVPAEYLNTPTTIPNGLETPLVELQNAVKNGLEEGWGLVLSDVERDTIEILTMSSYNEQTEQYIPGTYRIKAERLSARWYGEVVGQFISSPFLGPILN
jgi:hypothetical protein